MNSCGGISPGWVSGPLAPATWVSPHLLLAKVADIGATLPNAKLELLSMQTSGTRRTDRSPPAAGTSKRLNEEYADFIRELRLKLPAFRYNLHDASDAFTAASSWFTRIGAFQAVTLGCLRLFSRRAGWGNMPVSYSSKHISSWHRAELYESVVGAAEPASREASESGSR